MATRSLTEIYILMRNNAIQDRNIYYDEYSTDREALVHNVEGIELSPIPPSWNTIVEDSHYIIIKLKSKLNSLRELHSKAISRPAFDDSTHDEVQIQNLTDEISRIYKGLYKNISLIENEKFDTRSPLEKQLLNSVARALFIDIQNLYSDFKSMENNYKNRLKIREERSKTYFLEEEPEEVILDFGQQQDFIQKNYQVALDTEAKVDSIANSVIELKDIYKELSRLVIDQGTVLDRIDYNIETTQCQVKQATGQLAKAANYQRKNRKMMCIICLAMSITFMTALLIIIKF